MSTGANCYFEEREPGRWWYRLQRSPYGDTEEYSVYGPFSSHAAALRDLDQNHANPGGWSTRVHPTGHVHEWDGRGADRRVGFNVVVRVESLGPDASREDVVALVQGLSPDRAAIRVVPITRWDERIVTCGACGKEKS